MSVAFETKDGFDKRAIHIVRTALGMSQADLAQHMGLTHNYVRQVVGGFAPVTDEFKEKFGHAVTRGLWG